MKMLGSVVSRIDSGFLVANIVGPSDAEVILQTLCHQTAASEELQERMTRASCQHRCFL